jgi:peptide-methionine (S)-S-oxide reductase
VGYAGGTTTDPTYYHIGDYSETVQVDYDPARVSYDQLLDAFWNSHNASADAYSNQYRSIIFYHDEDQRAAATASLAREEARSGLKIQTAIILYTGFYLAEDYHQKYYLRDSDLFSEISSIYPANADFVNSTAAARLNGYLGGNGDTAAAIAQLGQFGLSEEGKKELLKIVERGLSPVCPVS